MFCKSRRSATTGGRGRSIPRRPTPQQLDDRELRLVLDRVLGALSSLEAAECARVLALVAAFYRLPSEENLRTEARRDAEDLFEDGKKSFEGGA